MTSSDGNPSEFGSRTWTVASSGRTNALIFSQLALTEQLRDDEARRNFLFSFLRLAENVTPSGREEFLWSGTLMMERRVLNVTNRLQIVYRFFQSLSFQYIN